MALKDPGIGFTLLLCGPTKMHGPRGSTRPILVLTTGITTDERSVEETREPRWKKRLLEIW